MSCLPFRPNIQRIFPIAVVGEIFFSEIQLVHTEHDGNIFRLPLFAIRIAVGHPEFFHDCAACGVEHVVRGGHIGEAAAPQRAERGRARFGHESAAPQVAAERIAEVAVFAEAGMNIADGFAGKADGTVQGYPFRILFQKAPHDLSRVPGSARGEKGEKPVRPFVGKKGEELFRVLFGKSAQDQPLRFDHVFHAPIIARPQAKVNFAANRESAGFCFTYSARCVIIFSSIR